jgi:hypothetical protein
MQRSIFNKNPLMPFLYTIAFMVYLSLSSIYLFMPPLLAVLFVIISKALKKEEGIVIFLALICLLLFEAEKEFLLFSTIIFFVLIHKFVIPKLNKFSSCKGCVIFLTVLISYLGYFLFVSFISSLFLLPMPTFTFYILYYIVIEFFIVSLL